MVPVVLVGLVGILWAATWFERVVAPITFGIEVPIPEIVDTVVADSAVNAESLVPGSSMPVRLPSIRADMAAALDA